MFCLLYLDDRPDVCLQTYAHTDLLGFGPAST